MSPICPENYSPWRREAGASEPTGHVFRVERKRGPGWYAKYRLPVGRQVQKRIGPAWAQRGRPPVGYFTKRTAEAWLRETLLGDREHWTGDDDLVFAGEVGSYLDGSAPRRWDKVALAVAGLRSLRFHDLRHTFGTRMMANADIRRVQEWMGHADIQTTMMSLHYVPHEDDARLVAEAFSLPATAEPHEVGS